MNSKLFLFLIGILFFPEISNSQVIATTGQGQDDSKILEYLKNKKWTQRTESETIEMEFIGFEKESNYKAFSNGAESNSGSTDPVKNMIFTKNDNLRETFYFNGNGSLSYTYLNTSPITGTYKFIESEKKLYVNTGNRQRIFTINYRSGKNLGVSGESVDDVRLYETNGSSEFIKTGNNSSSDGQYKSKNYDYLLPENRFLFKYTVFRKRFVTENGSSFVKDVQDVKYGFIYKISVTRRENNTGIRDSNGVILSNTNIPWAEAVLELVVSVGKDTYKPNTSVSQMIESGVAGCSIIVCNDCKTTDKKFSIAAGLDKLYINTCLHDAGWYYNETIGKNYEYYLSATAKEAKPLSPCLSGDCNNGFGTYKYKNGDTYVGEWLDGNPQGKGTFLTNDGDKYEGDFTKGKPNGKGTREYKNGDKYYGDFINGNMHGYGIYTFKNGDKYDGGWLNGNFHGKGTLTYSDGDEYVGEWLNSKKHGNGIFTLSGNKLIGEFIDDRLKNGTYIDKNGDKYVGGLLSGKPQGYGIYTFADGRINKGIFENGNFVGEK
jgi:hypothetical protein